MEYGIQETDTTAGSWVVYPVQPPAKCGGGIIPKRETIRFFQVISRMEKVKYCSARNRIRSP
eukprot:scaffold733_cov97-Cylindrotheca_fusiformis.AAC.3